MKKLLLSAGVLLLATGAFAQTKMSGEKGRLGVKAGVNLAKIHASGTGDDGINDNTKSNVGYTITAFGDFGVGKNLFIQPGISLQNKGSKTEIGSFTNKKDIMAIEVPINAVLRIPTGDAGAVQISAGPYIGFNVSGKNKVTATAGSAEVSGDRDLKFGSSAGDDFKGTDFGANFGLAYRLNTGIQVGANYGLGLSDLTPKDNGGYKQTNRVLGFTVGYSF